MKRFNAPGFTLIEMMMVLLMVAILAAIALPNYQEHVVRSARVQAQGELLELSSLQEKIFLNSNAYCASVSAAYSATAAGGLGRSSGLTQDGRYELSLDISTPSQTYVLTATPVPGGSQADDGILSISESGQRIWGSGTW